MIFVYGLEPKEFQSPVEEYGSFSGQLKARSTSDSTRHLTTFRQFPSRLVEAPITEIVCSPITGDSPSR